LLLDQTANFLLRTYTTVLTQRGPLAR